MELLSLDQGKLSVSPESLTIKEFSDIWTADTTKTKDDAIKELSFVYFMCWYKSPYRGYDVQDRMEHLKIDVIRDAKWKMPERVGRAMVKYEELLISNSPAMGLLKDAQHAILKVREYFRTVDIKNDTKGTKMATLLKSISSVDSVIKGLASLENKVEQELESIGRVRGGGRIGNRELPKEKRAG
jgi:hypothetical protein